MPQRSIFFRCLKSFSPRRSLAARRSAILAAARDAVALRQLQEATEQPATGPTKDTHLEALQILTLANQPGAAERLRKVALSVLPVERVELAAVLAEVTDAQAVALLTPLLSDPQSKVRQRALAALGRLACRGQWPGSTDVLIPLLNDADAQVALTAAVSLVAASAAAASQAEAPQTREKRRLTWLTPQPRPKALRRLTRMPSR